MNRLQQQTTEMPLTAMTTQNLLLGACWMRTTLCCAEPVSRPLAIANDGEPQALVTLGYPAAPGKSFQRRPPTEFARYPKGES